MDDILSGLPELPDLAGLEPIGEENAGAGYSEVLDDEVDEALVKEITDFFVSFMKTLRAAQLYVEGNPLLHQFFDDLQNRLRAIFERFSVLSFAVYETEIRWQKAVIYEERLTAPENLAFQLYKDGIRRFEFLPGVEEEEMRSFIDVLRLSKTLRGEEDDLLTLLWNTNFNYIRYEYVDILGDEPPPIPEADLEKDDGTELPLLPDLELSPELQAPTLSEDFEPSLYFLDEADVTHLQQELQREWSRSVKRDVMLALLDQFEAGDKDRRYEIMAILRQMLPRVLAEGDFKQAAWVVGELGAVADKGSDPEVGDQVDEILGELSEPIVLEQLVKVLEDGLVAPESEELATLLDSLKPGAIVVLIQSLPFIARPEAREILVQTLDRLAGLNPASIQKLVASADPLVAAEAARIVGRTKMAEGAGAVAQLLGRAEPEVRLAAVSTLVKLRSSRAGKPLLKAIRDEMRDVRIAAARGLRDLRFNPGADELEALVKDKDLWTRDLTEQRAVFEAYAAAAGSSAIKLLGRILNGRRILWFRYPDHTRACAARGLGLIGNDDAVRVLAIAQRVKDPMVRSAIMAAQRGPMQDEEEEASSDER